MIMKHHPKMFYLNNYFPFKLIKCSFTACGTTISSFFWLFLFYLEGGLYLYNIGYNQHEERRPPALHCLSFLQQK